MDYVKNLSGQKLNFAETFFRAIKYANLKDDLELVSAIQIIRHGARTGKMKTQIESTFGMGMQLTFNGFRQQMTLGEAMRNKYIKTGFLHEDKIEEEFEIIATKTQRTIYSSIGFLCGLFPGVIPEIKFEEKDELKDIKIDDFAPIFGELEKYKNKDINKGLKLKVLSPINETLFHAKFCTLDGVPVKDIIKGVKKKILRETYKSFKLPDYMVPNEEEKKAEHELLTKILCISEEELNIPDEKGEKKSLKNYLSILFTVPYHLNKDIFSPEISANARHLYVKTFLKKKYGISYLKNNEGYYLITSHFYQEMLDHFNESIQNPNKSKKYIVYEAHDGNILPILMNLISTKLMKKAMIDSLDVKEAFDFITVPFCSFFLFELYRSKSNGKYFVIPYYNGFVVESIIKEHQISKENKDLNDGIIPFDEFEDFLKNKIINPKYKELVGDTSIDEDEG